MNVYTYDIVSDMMVENGFQKSYNTIPVGSLSSIGSSFEEGRVSFT